MIASLARPSWKNGFARSAAESAYPGLWDGLAGAWRPGLGVTGSTLFDLGMTKLHGTVLGPTWTLGHPRIGYSLQFVNASSQYVSMGTPGRLAITGDLTISAWHKANSNYTTSQAIGACSNGGSNVATSWALTFGYATGKYHFWNTGFGPEITSTITVADNAWRHVVATRRGSGASTEFEIWIDGVRDATDSSAINTPGTGTETAWGRYGSLNSYYLEGWLAEPTIWSRALAGGEIKSLYRDPHAIERPRVKVFPAAVAAGGFAGRNRVLGGGILG